MKKFIYIISIILVSGCVTPYHTQLTNFKNKNSWKYVSMSSNPYGYYVVMGGSNKSQLDANNIAISGCTKNGGKNCILYFEGDKEVFEENKNKWNQERLVKKCQSFGFKKNTNDLSKCVFDLYKLENVSKNSNSNSDWSGLGKGLENFGKMDTSPKDNSINCTSTRTGNTVQTNCR